MAALSIEFECISRFFSLDNAHHPPVLPISHSRLICSVRNGPQFKRLWSLNIASSRLSIVAEAFGEAFGEALGESLSDSNSAKWIQPAADDGDQVSMWHSCGSMAIIRWISEVWFRFRSTLQIVVGKIAFFLKHEDKVCSLQSDALYSASHFSSLTGCYWSCFDIGSVLVV